jgi:hypothetical protein
LVVQLNVICAYENAAYSPTGPAISYTGAADKADQKFLRHVQLSSVS